MAIRLYMTPAVGQNRSSPYIPSHQSDSEPCVIFIPNVFLTTIEILPLDQPYICSGEHNKSEMASSIPRPEMVCAGKAICYKHYEKARFQRLLLAFLMAGSH